jgi:polysaccharide biosynthesis protein PslH
LRVLAVTPTPTHPPTAGNRVRIGALLDRLQACGAAVRVAHVAHEAGDLAAMNSHWNAGAVRIPFRMPRARHHIWNRFAERCRRILGLSVSARTDVDDWYDPDSAVPFAAEVSRFAPDVILMVYVWHSALLEHVPRNVLRVLDAQDVFTDRNARMASAGVAQEWFSVSRSEEARGVQRFDVVLAIQETEAQHYRSLSAPHVVTVGHFLPVLNTGQPASAPRLLIVASDNAINVDGVSWFLSEVWPRVFAERPDARVQLVGAICGTQSPQPGVLLSGRLDDLTDAYAAARIVVNPLRGGTGLKIKAAEALAAGRPVVSTPSAAEGLEDAIGRGIVVSADAATMTSDILALLRDDAEVNRLSRAARTFGDEWNVRNAQAFDAVFAGVRNARST